MKNFTSVIVLVGIMFYNLLISSCSKQEVAANKPLDAIAAKWSINRIQLKLYYSGIFLKDSIIPRNAQGENFVQFDIATKVFQYRFNSTITDVGTYVLKGADSIISTTPSKIYNWKMLTLTDELFTAISTSTTDPSFPGATVETYYTFRK